MRIIVKYNSLKGDATGIRYNCQEVNRKRSGVIFQ